ncbi:MAG: phosphoribosylanthranilate isomerase [Desulfobacteraceae bacterium]|nr:phosphoribosylanthranilate isomerase [Desulfobacteraceae bacterium]
MIKRNKIKFIKICGLTDPEAALACVHAGADAIGLVFFKKSPRHVSDEKALEICQALPSNIITTGVFVNEDFNYIIGKVEKLSLKAVQLHGNEEPELIDALRAKNVMVIKGLFAKRNPYLKNAYLYKNASYLLAECGKGVLPGGNAETWNWSEIAQIDTKLPIILAGGLSPSNVNNAINQVDISGVDVSSGVESTPGIKDLNKIAHFIKQVKAFQ